MPKNYIRPSPECHIVVTYTRNGQNVFGQGKSYIIQIILLLICGFPYSSVRVCHRTVLIHSIWASLIRRDVPKTLPKVIIFTLILTHFRLRILVAFSVKQAKRLAMASNGQSVLARRWATFFFKLRVHIRSLYIPEFNLFIIQKKMWFSKYRFTINWRIQVMKRKVYCHSPLVHACRKIQQRIKMQNGCACKTLDLIYSM